MFLPIYWIILWPFFFHTDQRLTEQEASDEIRSLLENFVVQLQAVKDRVPARGSAIGTIGVLLDNCKPISNPQALLTVSTLAVPPSTPSTNNANKTEYTLNGSQLTTDLASFPPPSPPSSSQPILAAALNLDKQCMDKSTNTIQITSNGNSMHYLHTTQMPQTQTNGKIAPVPNSVDRMVHDPVEQTTINSDANIELNFRNLDLKCMCSGDMGSASEHHRHSATIDDADVASHETSTTLQPTTTITTDDSQRCSHCGRGHCCFFLRCCHCLANDGLELAKDDVAVNVSATGPPDQNAIVCGNNNGNNKLAVDRNVSVRSPTASQRCDEICKIQCCGDTEQIKSSELLGSPLGDKKCCDPVGSNVEACHCQWYCLQECVSDTNVSKRPSVSNEHTSNLQVTPIEIEEKLMRNDVTADDENQLRCCRCSRELFWHHGNAVRCSCTNQMQPHHDICNNRMKCIDSESKSNNDDNAEAGASLTTTSRPHRKLILDLNDRSKYTKEVSV